MGQQMLNKSWRILTKLLLGIVAVVSIFLVCGYVYSRYSLKKSIKEEITTISNIKMSEVDILVLFDKLGGLQGGGYTFAVISLPNDFVRKELPHRENWYKIDWSNSQFKNEYSEIYDLAFHYCASDTKLQDILNKLDDQYHNNELISACYYYPSTESPRHVLFYAANIKEKQLYTIDSEL